MLRLSGREVFQEQALGTILLGSLAFTGALLLPLPEPVIAALVLASLAFIYAEVVRRCGLAGALGAGAAPIRLRAYAARASATLAVALLLTNAWEFARVWFGYAPGRLLFNEALAVAAALALVFPLAMLTVWAAPHPRQSLAAIARHPVSTAVALMIVPLGLVAAEALVVFVTSLQGYFSFYVLDLFPNSEELAPKFGIPLAGNYEVVLFPDDNHLALYTYYLKHGLPLSLALPSSLMNAPTILSRPWILSTSGPTYLAMRAFHTALVASVWLTSLALQARCLGLLARLWDWQRPRSPVKPDRNELNAPADAATDVSVTTIEPPAEPRPAAPEVSDQDDSDREAFEPESAEVAAVAAF
jgi:hypothetical protein